MSEIVETGYGGFTCPRDGGRWDFVGAAASGNGTARDLPQDLLRTPLKRLPGSAKARALSVTKISNRSSQEDQDYVPRSGMGTRRRRPWLLSAHPAGHSGMGPTQGAANEPRRANRRLRSSRGTVGGEDSAGGPLPLSELGDVQRRPEPVTSDGGVVLLAGAIDDGVAGDRLIGRHRRLLGCVCGGEKTSEHGPSVLECGDLVVDATKLFTRCRRRIPGRDAGGASAIVCAWSTCPECRERRWTG
jgi:hypothetical protein